LIQKAPLIDRLTAIKSYLGLVRKLEGFGEEKFPVHYQDISFGVTPRLIADASLSVGPIMLAISSGGRLLRSIPYKLLVSFGSMGHRLLLKFVNDIGKISTVELKVKDIGTVQMLINYNIKLIRELMLSNSRRER
jgi:hypothetical protein